MDLAWVSKFPIMETQSSYENTNDAIYDSYHPKYGDVASIERELDRTFDLCNGCRMCFKYCPSFPTLFKAMDRTEADVTKVTGEEKAQVIGECYQCRICYVVCPYTETDKHPYVIDFPALMLRSKILATQKKGVKLREKLLGNPDFLGRLNTGWVSYLVNKSMKNSFHRQLLHSVLGLHKKKLMPDFHRRSFATWFKKHRKQQKKNLKKTAPLGETTQNKIVLFSTCFVNYNNPQIGQDAISVLEKNRVHVEHPKQNCCGMPNLECGDLKAARKKMKRNVKRLLPYVRQGYKVLAINPTCSMTLKQEYDKFLAPAKWREAAKEVSQATMDLHEYLFELKKSENFNQEFKSSPGKVAYHVPCHLRAQNIGFKSRDILKLIPQTQVTPVAECCGHDGTWAIKKEYFEMSLKAGKRAFEGLQNQNAEKIATDCPLAAIQLQQGMMDDSKERPEHPIQLLAKAYCTPEEGGFSNPIDSMEA